MSDIQISAYLYNVQLTKLVSSADVLLQHIYNLLSPQNNKELRDCIFTWLCDKEEVDNCCLTNKRRESIDSDLSSSETFDSENSQEISDESYAKSDAGIVSVDESFAENDEKSSSTCSKNSSSIPLQIKKIATNSKIVNFDQGSVSESSLNNSSFKFCRYCSNETNECSPISSLPVGKQIEQLRNIKEPLLKNCQNITKFTRQRDLEKNPQMERLFMYQEILELIDVSIEIKSDPRVMNKKFLELTNTNFCAYSTICNFLKTLSASENFYLFVVLIQKVVELRESSYPLDKLILQLDNDIVDKEVRLHHLNKNYEKLKDACLSLSKKTGIKLGSTRAPQMDDICCVLTKSHLTEPQDENSQLLPCNVFSNKSDRSPATLLNIPSKSLCVSRQGKKLVFHHNKQS